MTALAQLKAPDDLMLKLKAEAASRVEALGHKLKAWSIYDTLEASSCERCGKAVFVDYGRTRYTVDLEGPALKYPCHANCGRGGA